jgi:polysaccharide export outer membrane protein
MTVASHSLPARAGRAALLSIVVLSLAACANKRGGSIPYEPANFGRPDIETLPVVPVNQKIGPLDTIDVRVFQVAELSGEHKVDTNGFINMPLIGKVLAQGKSAEELGQHLADRLGQKYLRSPNVNVMVKDSVAQTVTIDGAVGLPGIYPIQGATSLIKAVASARGTTPDANPRRVVVFRNLDGKRTAAQFDLQMIRRGEAADPQIYGNDIVVVDGNTSRSAYREVLQALPLVGLLNTFIPY